MYIAPFNSSEKQQPAVPKVFLDLPDEIIAHVLSYSYLLSSPKHPGKWLAGFGCLHSKCNRIMKSKASSQIWSKIPICLCNSSVCKSCEREKIPLKFYNNILSNCKLTKMDAHVLQSDYSLLINSNFKNTSNTSLVELNLQIYIPNLHIEYNKVEVNEYVNIENNQSLNDNNVFNSGNNEESSVKIFENLKVLFLNMEVVTLYVTNNQYITYDLLLKKILQEFGNKLLELSVYCSSLLNEITYLYLYKKHNVSNNLQYYCPNLLLLELNGNLPCMILKNQTFLSHNLLQKLYVRNSHFLDLEIPNYDIELPNPRFFLPNVVEFLCECDFQKLEHIIDVLQIIPLSATSLTIIGNISYFINDILSYVSIIKPINIKNITSLEIFDNKNKCYTYENTTNNIINNDLNNNDDNTNSNDNDINNNNDMENNNMNNSMYMNFAINNNFKNTIEIQYFAVKGLYDACTNLNYLSLPSIEISNEAKMTLLQDFSYLPHNDYLIFRKK